MKALLIYLIFLNILNVTTTFANERGNGGDITPAKLAGKEALLNSVKANLYEFFHENKGKLQETFTDFRIDDLLEKFEKSSIKVTSEELKDRYNITRSCLNYSNTGIIDCNYDLITQATHDSLFILVLHEHLNQLGVEISDDSHETGNYSVSSKLSLYLVEGKSFQLKMRETVNTPKGDLQKVELKRISGALRSIFTDKEKGLKLATFEEAKFQCHIKYQHCEVLKSSYYSTCGKIYVANGQMIADHSCTGSVYFRGKNSVDNNTIFSSIEYYRTKAPKAEKHLAELTKANALLECYSKGYEVCEVLSNYSYKINSDKFRTLNIAPYWQAKSVVKGTKIMENWENRIFSIYDYKDSCSNSERFAEAIKQRALIECNVAGMNHCKVTHEFKSKFKGTCYARSVVRGDF